MAFVDDASATAVNPARLDRVDHFSGVLTASPFLPRTVAPFSATRRQSTETTVVPLFFVGAAGRLFDPLTTGVALYVASGVGARYENLPEFGGLDMNVELAVLEAALPVAYRVNDQLAVGIAVRFAYAMLEADLPLDIGGQYGPLRIEMDLNGYSFPGLLAGVSYEPSDNLAFGATYRSKMTIDLEGEGTVTYPLFGGPVTVASEWSSAHSFRIGGAWRPGQQLLVALDVGYTLLDEAVDRLPVVIDFQNIDSRREDEEPLQWRDSIAAALGAEYWLEESWAARLGYQINSSGTPEEYANPLMPPPGLIQTLHAGGGFRTARIRIDAGAGYAFAGGAEVERTDNGEAAGEYGGDYWLLGASFTYQN